MVSDILVHSVSTWQSRVLNPGNQRIPHPWQDGLTGWSWASHFPAFWFPLAQNRKRGGEDYPEWVLPAFIFLFICKHLARLALLFPSKGTWDLHCSFSRLNKGVFLIWTFLVGMALTINLQTLQQDGGAPLINAKELLHFLLTFFYFEHHVQLQFLDALLKEGNLLPGHLVLIFCLLCS